MSSGKSQHCCPVFLLPFSPHGIEMLPYSFSSLKRPADSSLSAIQELFLLPSQRLLSAPWLPSVHQFSSVSQSCSTLFYVMGCSTSEFPVHHQLPQLAQTHVHQVVDATQQFCFLFYPLPSAFNLSSIMVFSKGSVLPIKWPKYWRFSFSIGLSKEYSGMISFRMEWLDLLADQGTFGSLFQNCSPEASVLWYSAFFMVQFSHPPTASGKKP